MSAQRTEMIAKLRAAGYVYLPRTAASAALQLDVPGLEALCDSWERLPRDTYLRDGGRYRARRHSCLVQTFAPATLETVPHRPHWQPTSYNALHGGLTRWFEPIDAAVSGARAWQQLVTAIGEVFAEVASVPRWFIETHQFRIDTADGIGRPTPEGAHRDGVDFVAVVLVARRHVRGGETRVFEADGTSGVRFTMREPWSMLLMDDARVIHETTPIQPHGSEGVRDTLVVTYRSQGFQAP
ncbi:MAG TPA: 2OG-Fe dioxygenase family protein [Steroidobacteraceae bacterium]|jgi:hypothetical protein